MPTDDVILGTITPFGDHIHLEWVCCDCGAFCFIGANIGRYRHVCVRTGREFLVVGIPRHIEPVSRPGPSDLTRRSRELRAFRTSYSEAHEVTNARGSKTASIDLG